ncbi:long-chain-fatty-acid--CoA ligase [Galbitalea sp. SE-J8]|uniref:long-chain-fatty-acid--CoA ligase n=1 Tax=Galbitalea sp. SE-J8 TaxID=3054952 RepID=UPI00259C923B|nr:long-chain-fatty-acid--CoA ligase [Galbitalea sp. SE-J8]MDM4764192.1 long-chain-fatty-acid--CoA ligase [Galbitalea sp. SE-J8]
MSDAARPWLTSYADGVPHDIETPTGSLYDLLHRSAQTYADHVALEFFGAETSYARLDAQIGRAAAALAELGVKKGDPVAIVLPNAPQHIVAFYAVLRLGAIVVEHNPLYTPSELEHQFEDHGATTVIAWSKVVGTIQGFAERRGVTSIVSVDIIRGMPVRLRLALHLPIPRARSSRAELRAEVSGVLRWDDLVAHEPLAASVPGPGADDVALIQYTSGTTGRPKGATLTHANLLANAAQARAWVPQIERGTSVVYAVLPMFHAYGLTLCLTFAMSMGARLVLFPRFDPDLVLPVITKRPATFLPAVPPIYDRLTRAADAKGVSLDGIRIAISGAMALSRSVVEPWEAKTHGVLVEGYGLSETSPVLMANPVAGNRKAGTIGLPMPSTEVRVVDPEDPMTDVAAGEPGELVVRGPQVMSGYWNKPDETAAVFVDDPAGGAPWFRTGDIVAIDADGFVSIVDRIKELIITGGFNVSPTEVEDTLKAFDGIADAAVVGLPDARHGERVTAVVVLEPGATLDERAAEKHVRETLTPYKVPREWHVVDELPRSLIGKVQRKIVRDDLLAQQPGQPG